MPENKSNSPSSIMNIATMGSKNRVCMPPNLVNHLEVKPGDKVVWILGRNKQDKPFAYMRGVKPENFEVDTSDIELAAKVLIE